MSDFRLGLYFAHCGRKISWGKCLDLCCLGFGHWPGATACWYLSVGRWQTPSTGLQHPSSNHGQNWLCLRSWKTVSSWKVLHWCSNGSKFVTENSDCIRHFLHNCLCCLHQHKQKQKLGQKKNMFTCVLGRCFASAVWLVPRPFGGWRVPTMSVDSCVEIKSASSVI